MRADLAARRYGTSFIASFQALLSGPVLVAMTWLIGPLPELGKLGNIWEQLISKLIDGVASVRSRWHACTP
jgi:hypothetical protein